MKRALAVTIAIMAFSAFAEDATTTIVAKVTLKDGTTVKGEFSTKAITGSALFMEKLELGPAIVKSLAFSSTNGESKVELANGDKFSMTVTNESFALKSLLGDLTIPRANFRIITFSPQKATAGSAEDGLIFHCTFDDEASLASPLVGPPVKLELGRICPDKGKDGGALFVKPGIAGAQVVFPAGTFGDEGCIEFWANMASGKTEFSTGGDPRFFILTNDMGSECSHLQFASNDGCGNSGLCGHYCFLGAQTTRGCSGLMPYSDVFKGEDYNGWHHYALVWSPSIVSIYLDGKQVCSANGTVNATKAVNSNVIMDIPLNREHGKSFNNKSAFYMDDLKIWNYAKREFTIN